MIKYLIKNEWLIFTTPRTLISPQMLGIQNQLFFSGIMLKKFYFLFNDDPILGGTSRGSRTETVKCFARELSVEAGDITYMIPNRYRQ